MCPSEFRCYNFNCQCSSAERQDLQEVIRSCGSALRSEPMPLSRWWVIELSWEWVSDKMVTSIPFLALFHKCSLPFCLLPWADAAWSPSAHVGPSILHFPTSIILRNKSSLFANFQPQVFCYSSPKWTKTGSIFSDNRYKKRRSKGQR